MEPKGMETFGSRLTNCRKQKRMTMLIVSKLLDISQPAYSKYEYGTREPNFERLIKIADIFGVTLDYLFGRETQIEQVEETKKSVTFDDIKIEIVIKNITKEA